MDRYNYIKERLEDMTTSEIIEIHNQYCEESNYTDNIIFDMNLFDEVCEGMTPTDIAQKIFYGDFKICDDYFCFNGYANFDSFNYSSDENSPIDFSDIARYMNDNEEAFNTDILEDYEEEEEE